MPYAGDITCLDCWESLKSDAAARLIDVRTMAEWNFVGVPDLEPIGREIILAEWQQFPEMNRNAGFVDLVSGALTEDGLGADAPLYLICRSGARSIAAAEALTAAGYSAAHNVLGGFEGDRDENGQRGNVAGWKHDGLPWVQR